MPIHDLVCTTCGAEYQDEPVAYRQYGICACGGARTWVPSGFRTDVCGSEQVAPMLRDEYGNVLSYRSSRERDAKMKRLGYEPAGDPVGGARNQDGYKQSLFSGGGLRGRRGTPPPPMRGRRA